MLWELAPPSSVYRLVRLLEPPDEPLDVGEAIALAGVLDRLEDLIAEKRRVVADHLPRRLDELERIYRQRQAALQQAVDRNVERLQRRNTRACALYMTLDRTPDDRGRRAVSAAIRQHHERIIHLTGRIGRGRRTVAFLDTELQDGLPQRRRHAQRERASAGQSVPQLEEHRRDLLALLESEVGGGRGRDDGSPHSAPTSDPIAAHPSSAVALLQGRGEPRG